MQTLLVGISWTARGRQKADYILPTAAKIRKRILLAIRKKCSNTQGGAGPKDRFLHCVSELARFHLLRATSLNSFEQANSWAQTGSALQPLAVQPQTQPLARGARERCASAGASWWIVTVFSDIVALRPRRSARSSCIMHNVWEGCADGRVAVLRFFAQKNRKRDRQVLGAQFCFGVGQSLVK